ncbi:MAG TPA: tRNA preQ1(34) S-adenosylmethionine ribosyltransferase-isomerase QueA [Rhodocyclaceae bacterium]|nr:tRNA preQ1(34) S-adenosylmethionine ribosyltransferase-isomerase QueA [Rhodocyclaceae bacterium]
MPRNPHDADRNAAQPSLSLSDFDFALPPELIAQHPLPERTGSRLLQLAGGQLHDRQFAELSDLLRPGDLLVLNNTRVIRARFFGQKTTGGNVEVMLERIAAPHQALAMIRASKSPKPGSTIRLAEAFDCIVSGRAGENGEFFALTLDPASDDWWTLAERYGRLPLPPYIEHSPDSFDEERYQTVYSQHAGAVAAPTAGLHFDDALFARLQKNAIDAAFLTLHVGAGTFQPVRVENLAEHRMHREHFEIPADTVAGRAGENDEFFALTLPAASADWWTLAERYGRLPLPPYIEHSPDSFDEERYQTVYSQHAGAVAAPTAGLHFDDALFARLQKNAIDAAFLTLHVGAGTFQPVRVENLAEHRMHREHYEIPPATVAAIRTAKAAGRRVVAVGTTSLRALESAAATSPDGLPQAGAAESEIFITPGFEFKVVDALITNFHLPKSTLLMLVSAFAGMDAIRRAYAHAIAQRYRFFSYGDAMLLERKTPDEI